MAKLTVDLEKVAHTLNQLIPLSMILFAILGHFISFYFHFLTVSSFLLTLINFSYLYGQKQHALLANFGILAQGRYILESIGPELRQYLFANDTEEKPFNRIERAEVYRKALDVDSSSSFGTQLDYTNVKLLHSMFPVDKSKIIPFRLVFGEERGIQNTFTITKPIIISGMSFGALGEKAVRSLARGAKQAGIPMNTGEGGHPKYHIMEDGDLIFQMGTAKFGVRHTDGRLDEERLKQLSAQPQIKMIEIKLSQGAKPGKGGLLPKEKITEEIAQLRGVEQGKDVISPSYHSECTSPETTVTFIKRIQDLSQLPVGIKFCLGRIDELRVLLTEMKAQQTFPDFITIDGAEGGTGAAPKSFMDEVGMPLIKALPQVHHLLIELGIRDRLKILASGKLINAGKQLQALSLGADAICSARGFMLAIGCIQALQCNKNSCPVGITTHNPALQRGLDVDLKAERVYNYVKNLMKDHKELLSATGHKSWSLLSSKNLYQPQQDSHQLSSSIANSSKTNQVN
jgi:glutamate synthase domain-containing protein 2